MKVESTLSFRAQKNCHSDLLASILGADWQTLHLNVHLEMRGPGKGSIPLKRSLGKCCLIQNQYSDMSQQHNRDLQEEPFCLNRSKMDMDSREKKRIDKANWIDLLHKSARHEERWGHRNDDVRNARQGFKIETLVSAQVKMKYSPEGETLKHSEW